MDCNVVEMLEQELTQALTKLLEADPGSVQVQPTRSEFTGDYTLVIFPWVKQARCAPEALGIGVGNWLLEHSLLVLDFNVVKGFLNITLREEAWIKELQRLLATPNYGSSKGLAGEPQTIMVEYASPNTNKPLHLGHIRNILLGHSVSNLLSAAGNRVVRVNLINDRGIHICKSMLAWLRYGDGETPESSGMKGDHLVGKYYVLFDQHYKAEVKELIERGEYSNEEEAKANAPILLEAQEMLRKWEREDPEIRALWAKMNGWVYAGFDATYETMGVHFDHLYYESETYALGKAIVQEGLKRGVFEKHEDGSVWCDLTSEGLDQKLLLRADGTSVYITQDLGTAVERFKEYSLDSMVYVVGNEQEYHFQVLRLLLERVGYEWADKLYHLSYGMVFLPEGKMKSREGTVVDADDLMASLFTIARETAESLGKKVETAPEEQEKIDQMVGLGALKYFMLKVDPSKNMVFDPRESIDFNGNTGPFIQYTHARACSILRKVNAEKAELRTGISMQPQERVLIRRLSAYAPLIQQAAQAYSPALVANYLYDLAREFNQFYHECPISREANAETKSFRILLTQMVVRVLAHGLNLLGIGAPERM